MKIIHPDIYKVIEKWLDYKGQFHKLPGMSVGILIDGKTVLAKSYGDAKAQSTYRIASISKTFTALAILQLVQKGKFKIDDPVSKYLPEIKSLKRNSKQDNITIRQLLNHNSLIYRDGMAGQWETGKFPSAKKLLDGVRQGALCSAKGTNWKYSNIGYSLLGLVIEKASSLTYEEYLQKHLFRPLGLTHTASILKGKSAQALTVGRIPNRPGKPGKTVPHYETYAMAGATGLSSNVIDLIKYMNAIINRSPQLLKKETWNLAFKQQWKHGIDHRNLFLTGTTKNKRMGHGGGFPGFATHISMDIKNKIGVVTLLNQNPAPVKTVTNGIFSIIAGSPKLLKKLSKFKRKPTYPLRYEGRYENLWGHVQVVSVNGHLVAFDQNANSPMENMALLEYIGNNTFTIHDEDGYGSNGEPAVFLFKGNKAVGLNWAGHHHNKIK